MAIHIRRREFIGALGGMVATWPHVARAQQPTMPVIGYVNSGTVAANPNNVAAFRLSLKEAGFTEGQNVAIEFRWAEGRYDQSKSKQSECSYRYAGPAGRGAHPGTTNQLCDGEQRGGNRGALPVDLRKAMHKRGQLDIPAES